MKITLLIFINICAVFYSAEYAYAYSTKDEFTAHHLEKGGCVTAECHADMSAGKKVHQHAPFIERDCTSCHLHEVSLSEDAGKLNQRMICAGCHKDLENEIVGSRFVHGPINIGDCSSCHNPHESDIKYLLKESYDKLCETCHKLSRLFAGDYLHQPVKDGNCGLCHDPHASNYKSRLTDVGANLCISCHDEMVTGMTYDYVHEPLVKKGCDDCHDPHAGSEKLRLKVKAEQLCFKCHKEKQDEVAQYKYMHKPAQEGRCVECHSPHFSETKALLHDEIDLICYKCHKESKEWKDRHFQHGPVVQGNCTACHNPHGSDNAFILRLSFPHKFYSSYEKGKYNLCFLCHKEVMITAEKTDTITSFRNGDINLHALHVNQKKGRTCRACHDVHASDQEDHIREEFRFGKADIPIYYRKTANGGTCIPGCHVERSYDRINAITN